MDRYDVIVIGGGVSGACAAYFLSQYDASVCLIEKEEDLCCGTSKANSAIIHAGYDAKPGTLKALMNKKGNEMVHELAPILDFPFKACGSLVLCKAEEDLPSLKALYERGLKNGIPGLKLLTGEETRALEPHVTPNCVGSLYAETAGIVDPFLMTIAFAEAAANNGVAFRFDTEVREIQRTDEGYVIKTSESTFEASALVNAAGVYADVLHNMVSEQKLHITARRGEYCLMDKTVGGLVGRTLFELPGKMGKGILVTPTVHGNLLCGPTAADEEDRECTRTTAQGMDYLLKKAATSVDSLPGRSVITSFAGLRAHEDGDDFVIGETEDAPGFFDLAGIESPGLSSAPALGQFIAEKIAEKYSYNRKADFKAGRKGTPHFSELSREEQNALIAQDPAYGQIICRCETVTEGEIRDAIRRPLGARSLDGVKRRVRAGMGRCQSGFCSPKVMDILCEETGMTLNEITKSGKGSEIGEGRTKA